MWQHTGPAPKGSGLGSQLSSCRVFVGNLPFEATVADVEKAFKRCGKVSEQCLKLRVSHWLLFQVLNVRLAYKEDGEFAGYGFVVFECAAGDNTPQDRAIALDGIAEVHDRVLAVSST